MRSSTPSAAPLLALDPFHLAGVRAVSGPSPAASDAAPSDLRGGPGRLTDIAGPGKPWSPDSPLFWFGLIAAVTFGLIGGATQIRVGPFTASASAGD